MCKQGYPKFIWVNFGRTVTEQGLQMFSDFGEQLFLELCLQS